VTTTEEFKEKRRAYLKEYYQRPEYKEKRKEHYQRPEYKEKHKEHYQRPEIKAYLKEYYQRPEYKEKRKEYAQRPEVKERVKKYEQKPEVKERVKKYQQKPENKERDGLNRGFIEKRHLIYYCLLCNNSIEKRPAAAKYCEQCSLEISAYSNHHKITCKAALAALKGIQIEQLPSIPKYGEQ